MPNDEDRSRIRAATLCLVNRERAERAESPVATNPRLEQAAQAHAEDMAFGDYLEHVGPRGDTPISRAQASGYIYNSNVGFTVGENIGCATLWAATPRAIIAAWMASPAHRSVILNPEYRDTGIGVWAHPPASLAGEEPGAVYTQDFGVIIPG
jgi:uncharacterized protein YkwD